MTRRIQYLTALLLALWLPSQALANVLVHCIVVDSAAASVSVHASHDMTVGATAEDCHGKTAVTAVAAEPGVHHESDTTDCFHCTGGCHKVQTMLTLERDAQRSSLAGAGLAIPSHDLAAGFPDFPIRPPIILSV